MKNLAQKYSKYEPCAGCECALSYLPKPRENSKSSCLQGGLDIFFPLSPPPLPPLASSFPFLIPLSLLYCCVAHCCTYSPKNCVGHIMDTHKY